MSLPSAAPGPERTGGAATEHAPGGSVALGPTRGDEAKSWLRTLAATVPTIGPVVAHLVGSLIPDQRLQRIERFLELLERRLNDMERVDLQERLEKPTQVDLFENGAGQAVRAVTDDRVKFIASVVANGISGEGKEELEAKRVLNILRELDDAQIIMLAAKLQKNWGDFWERHMEVVSRPVVTYGSEDDDRDKAALYDAARGQLVRLGLLSPVFRPIKKGELPEFDLKTGMLKSTRDQITPLGRMVLRHVGLADREDV